MKLFKKLGLLAGIGIMTLGVGVSINSLDAVETQAAITWVQVSDVASIVSGSKYLFTATYSSSEYYMDASGTAVSDGNGFVAGLKSALSTVSETETYTITAVSGGYEISDNSFKMYATNTNDGLRSSLTIPNGASGVWTFSATSGVFTISSLDNATTPAVRKLALYNGADWRCYSSTSGVQSIVLYKSQIVADVPPTSVTLALSLSSVGLGETSIGTATVLPENATNKQVTWMSSNELVATVSSTGIVTGVGAGTANITATSVANGTLSDTKPITVSGEAASVYDKTLTATKFGYGSSYVSGNYVVEGMVFYSENVMKQSNKNNSLQLKAATGFIYNASSFTANIKTITVDLETTNADTEYVLTVGTTNNPAIVVSGSTSGGLTVYDVSAAGEYKFFKLLNTGSSGTLYADAIIVEMVDTDVEAARTYADSFLSTLDAECAALSVSSATWTTLSNNYSSLNAAAKLAFTGETSTVAATKIQRALERYVYIVKKYGYTNFMGITIPAASTTTFDNPSYAKNIYTIVIVAIAGVTVLGGFFFTKKKKEIQN